MRQFCRKCLGSCTPAVTMTFPPVGGHRIRLHWCAEHADDADQYADSALLIEVHGSERLTSSSMFHATSGRG